MPSPAKPLLHLLWLLLVVIVVSVFFLLRWGGNLLINADPVPRHADAAIVLQGSIVAEKVRLGGAIDLLRQGIADRVLISVPKESYWGQSIPPAARAYLTRNYGSDLADRVEFCETGVEVNSTVQEVQALRPCIQERHLQSVVIVTSNYHTRRAGLLWRRMTRRHPALNLFIDGVDDPEFQQPWWRHRRSAKVWLAESTKLLWAVVGGR